MELFPEAKVFHCLPLLSASVSYYHGDKLASPLPLSILDKYQHYQQLSTLTLKGGFDGTRQWRNLGKILRWHVHLLQGAGLNINIIFIMVIIIIIVIIFTTITMRTIYQARPWYYWALSWLSPTHWRLQQFTEQVSLLIMMMMVMKSVVIIIFPLQCVMFSTVSTDAVNR